MKNKITAIGFELKKSFENNEGVSEIYEKGVIQLDLTYKDDKLKYCDLSIGENNFKNMKFQEILKLDYILNKKR